YRSSPDLVQIQHTLARAIDETYVPAESRTTARNDGAPCEVREYERVEAEATDLAALCRALVDEGLAPRDIAVLVRQRPQDYEPALSSAFSVVALRIRLEADLQDVLAERLTQTIVPFLRLGSVA